jgi:hypothetical protein
MVLYTSSRIWNVAYKAKATNVGHHEFFTNKVIVPTISSASERIGHPERAKDPS